MQAYRTHAYWNLLMADANLLLGLLDLMHSWHGLHWDRMQLVFRYRMRYRGVTNGLSNCDWKTLCTTMLSTLASRSISCIIAAFDVVLEANAGTVWRSSDSSSLDDLIRHSWSLVRTFRFSLPFCNFVELWILHNCFRFRSCCTAGDFF